MASANLAAAAGVAGRMACPKGFRHGFAVACIARNILLTTVQKWLGHARLETTAIYVGVCGEEERNLARRLWRETWVFARMRLPVLRLGLAFLP